MCEVLGVSRSGYYAYVKRLERGKTEKEKFNHYLDQRILHHFYDNLGTYGSPRICRRLYEVDKIKVSEKKVANRMRALNLFATPPKKYINTTASNHEQSVASNKLNQAFNPEAPNKVWATDITYIHTGEGFLYLNPIMDLYSRMIISYRMDDKMDLELSLNTLNEAISLREPSEGWIHHSDRGAQYCSHAYTEALKEAGADISMSRKGNPYDNACMESFFGSLKQEYLHKHVFATKAEARLAIQFYINFYNKKRMHSSLDYMSPLEKEEAYKLSNQQTSSREQNTSA